MQRRNEFPGGEPMTTLLELLPAWQSGWTIVPRRQGPSGTTGTLVCEEQPGRFVWNGGEDSLAIDSINDHTLDWRLCAYGAVALQRGEPVACLFRQLPAMLLMQWREDRCRVRMDQHGEPPTGRIEHLADLPEQQASWQVARLALPPVDSRSHTGTATRTLPLEAILDHAEIYTPWLKGDATVSGLVVPTEQLFAVFRPMRDPEGERCELPLGGDGVYRVESLPLLVEALLPIAPEMALDLLESTGRLRRKDGLLPAAYSGPEETGRPARPVMMASLLAAWRHLRRLEFIRRELSVGMSILEATVKAVDPERTGQPSPLIPSRGPATESSADPATSAETAVFLIHEIDCLQRIVQESMIPKPAGFKEWLHYRGLLARNREQQFWHDSQGCYLDRLTDGSPSPRHTLSAILPLLDERLPVRHRDALLRHALDEHLYFSAAGWRSWVPWDSEDDAVPVLAVDQYWMIKATRRDVLSDTRLRDAGSMILNARPAERNPAPVDPAACALQAWLFSRATASVPTAPKRIPVLASWWSRHRILAPSLSAGVVAVLVLGAFLYLTRDTFTLSQLETQSALAQRYYEEGHYAQSIEVYEKIRQHGGRFAPMVRADFAIGKAYFRLGDFERAALHFEREMEKDSRIAPMAMLNLALCRFRAGQYSESEALYTRFLHEWGDALPQFADRAATAAQLAREQSARE